MDMISTCANGNKSQDFVRQTLNVDSEDELLDPSGDRLEPTWKMELGSWKE